MRWRIAVKIKISRQVVYLVSLMFILLLLVLLFSFLVLIPEGKEYREQRLELKKENYELRRYKNYHEDVLTKLKKLQTDHRHAITALDNSFNPDRFQKQNQKFFKSLSITKKVQLKDEDNFLVYEVNTTSSIHSPKSFYNFLDAVNKGDWIISVNFPINFKRDKDLISSSFTMKIYKTPLKKELQKSED